MSMDQTTIINKTVEFVRESLKGAEWGHDWRHIFRVRNMAKYIAKSEKADLFVVELGALLHDIADSKFYNWDEEIGPHKTREFLSSLELNEEIITHVENIVRNISFKWKDYVQNFTSNELDVVQDADRLDAIGAIGIARAFNYGGYKGFEIYNPEIQPNLNMTNKDYKNNHSPIINRFKEKLFLLKDKMNTKTWKGIAKHRHEFMEKYLVEFHKEVEGEV